MTNPTDRSTRTRRDALVAGTTLLPLAGCVTAAAPFSLADRVAELRAAETAFAQTMADRDFAAFARFVADDAVFVNGGSPLRGKAAVLDHWQRFFAPGPAPFAWKPEIAEVLASGALGYTQGPVRSPAGVVFARFHSTWRRGDGGIWQVVFDNGTEVCKA